MESIDKLEGISTKDLVKELVKRSGVILREVEPHKEEGIAVCGPAQVLIVID